MKQGTGNSRSGATKVEPTPKAVSPGAVGNIGIQNVRYRSQQLYEGKGYRAPMASTSHHKSGSQGKH